VAFLRRRDDEQICENWLLVDGRARCCIAVWLSCDGGSASGQESFGEFFKQR